MRLTDNLVRAYGSPEALAVRSDDATGSTLFGHFAVFNRWTEIRSVWEGNFLERIAPGAFDRAFADPSRVKVLYDHGSDPSIGNKPLGTPAVLRADSVGAYYEVPLFRGARYVEDLVPAIAAGALGASFRFSVPAGGETWVERPERSTTNPRGLDERTITDLTLYEFGPVTFPAYADASAGMRSATDDFRARLNDPLTVAALTERLGPKVVRQMLQQQRDNIVLSITDDDSEECCCGQCGVMYDASVATACPVCGASTDAGDAPSSTDSMSTTDGLPRGMPLIAARHELLTLTRSKP